MKYYTVESYFEKEAPFGIASEENKIVGSNFFNTLFVFTD